MRKLFYLAFLIPTIALAQNAPSGSPRVQGTPDGFGAPVQVTLVGPDGADVSGTTANQVQGNVASGVADSGNPVKVGALAQGTSTWPTYTDGQRGNATLGVRGALRVEEHVPGTGAAFTALNNGADATSNAGWFRGAINFGLVFNGTTWDRQRGDTNGVAVHNGLGQWTYASGTTGILSNTTTAVTIKTAAGASVRNFIDSCQISTTAFGAAVPLAVRDGAGGAVIWAATVPLAGYTQPITVVFDTPLRGTANTLLEIVTTTANTTGSAMVNCQGHTGA
jgi:hypothetical protein